MSTPKAAAAVKNGDFIFFFYVMCNELNRKQQQQHKCSSLKERHFKIRKKKVCCFPQCECVSVTHSAVEWLVLLVRGLVGSVRSAASGWSCGAVTVDRLQAHRPLHLPWSRVGAR